MTLAELLWAFRQIASNLELRCRLVEVIPTGSAPPTSRRSSPSESCARSLGCSATSASTSGANLEMKLGPTPLISIRALSSAGRIAAIALRVRLLATV